MNHRRQQLPSQQMLRIFGSGAGVNGENDIRIWTENKNSLRINHLDFQAVCKSFVYFIILKKKPQKVLIQCNNTIVVLFINKYTRPLPKSLEIVDIGNFKQHSIKS